MFRGLRKQSGPYLKGLLYERDSCSRVMLLSPVPIVFLGASRFLLCHVGRQVGLME